MTSSVPGERPYFTVNFEQRVNPAPRNDRVRISSLRVLRQPNRHEIAVIRIAGDMGHAFPRYRQGTAVEILWGWSSQLRGLDRFVGYTDYLRPRKSESYTDVVCVGATFWMKQRKQRVFAERTRTDIAEEICKEHRLAFIGMPHSERVTTSQRGRSDWKFLCDLAEEIGYVVVSSGVTVFFVPRVWLFRQTKPQAKILRMGSNLLGFDPFLGEESPRGGEHADLLVHGLTLDGEIVTASGTPGSPVVSGTGYVPMFTKYADSLVTSPADADSTVQALLAGNVWTVQARASSQGIPRLLVGDAVVLEDTGVESDGLWAIEKSEVVINSNEFVSKLTLGRDGAGDNGERPTEGRRPQRAYQPVGAIHLGKRGWVAERPVVRLV